MEYRPEIDGLRALAVVPVILFHAGFNFFSGGYVGVDIFFVLSGYLITSIIILDLEKKTFSLLKFYERRARRILPALFFVLIAFLPVGILLLPASELENFLQSIIATLTFSSNFLFWSQSGYFDIASEMNPLLHTWSLAIEEQFYLIFPILFILLWKAGPRLLTIILFGLLISSLVLAHWTSTHMPSAGFFLLPTRFWELLLGASAALLISRPRFSEILAYPSIQIAMQSLGVILITSAVLLFNSETPAPSFYTLIPTIGVCLIIIFQEKTLITKFLSHKILVFLGLISYSAYLFHQPILVFSKYFLGNDLRGLGLPINPTLELNFLLVVLTFFIAYFSWRFIENPFRKNKINIFTKYWKSSILFFVISISIFSFTQMPERENINDIQFSQTWEEDARSNICHLEDAEASTHAGKCFADKQDILIWGDSHAASLNYGLQNAAKKLNLGYTQLTQSSCGPILNLPILEYRKNCNQVNRSILSHISESSYSLVILHSAWLYEGYPLTDAEFKDLIKRTFHSLKNSTLNTKIMIIGAVPRWQFGPDAGSQSSKFRWRDDQLIASKPFLLPEINTMLREEADKNNFIFIDPTKYLCDSSKVNSMCLIAFKDLETKKSTFAYKDYGHLSRDASTYLASKIFNNL